MMFSTNPFSHLTSNNIHVFPSSNYFLDLEKDDLYINNPNSFDCFPTWGKINSTTSDDHQNNLVKGLGLEQSKCDDQYNHDLFWSEVKNKKTSKKDHHSKIHTAQGPRDRRVRLSTEVAKRFFYLQDLLGFDKGSKTLDWLFSKSKVSIDELIKRKKQSSSSSTVTDQSEVVFMEAGSDEQDQKGRKNKCRGEGKRKKITRTYKSGFSVSQLRAEARARARERTKKKLNIKKKLDNESNTSTVVHVDCCSSNLTLKSSFWSSVESQNDYTESNMEDNISINWLTEAAKKLW
ncbi:hypothetical protein QVD17_09894 [Tagetes erecta]|uniref:Cycloidea-like protein n=1 Tax=Tagetes erecta TaxID=13708 RepID=A0AAD8NZ04_TARER|nr:hypothetical protein QVD17_09894 [Tagetes erecta]